MDRDVRLIRLFLVALLGCASLVAFGQAHAITRTQAETSCSAHLSANYAGYCTFCLRDGTNSGTITSKRTFVGGGFAGHTTNQFAFLCGNVSENNVGTFPFDQPASSCTAGSDDAFKKFSGTLGANGTLCNSANNCVYEGSDTTVTLDPGGPNEFTAGKFRQTGATCPPGTGTNMGTSQANGDYCRDTGGGYQMCKEGANVCVKTPKGNSFCWPSTTPNTQADHPDKEGGSMGPPNVPPPRQPDSTPYEADVSEDVSLNGSGGTIVGYSADPDSDGDGTPDDDEVADCPANNPDCEDEDDQEESVGDSPCGGYTEPGCIGDEVECGIYRKAWRIACEQEHSNKLLESLESTLDAELEETNAKLSALKDSNAARLRDIKAAVNEQTAEVEITNDLLSDLKDKTSEVKASTDSVKASTDSVKTAVDEVTSAVAASEASADSNSAAEVDAMEEIDFSVDQVKDGIDAVAEAIDGLTQGDGVKLEAIKDAVDQHKAKTQEMSEADRDHLDALMDMDGADMAGTGPQFGLEEAATEVEDFFFGPEDIDMNGLGGSGGCPAFPMQSVGGMPWGLPDDLWCDFLGVIRAVNLLLAAWWAASILMRA